MNTSNPGFLVATVAVAAPLALALAGCGSPGGGSREPGARPDVPMTLTVVSSDWNGWDRDHVPTPETTTLPVEVGAEVRLDMGVTFEVVEIDDTELELASDRELAPSGQTGGINLNDLVDGVSVVVGKESRLATPTMDGGHSFTFSLTVADDEDSGERPEQG